MPADVLLELVVVMRTTQTLHVTSESEHKDLTLTSTQTYIMFGWAQAITITGGKGTLLGSHFAHLLNYLIKYIVLTVNLTITMNTNAVH